MEIFNFAQEPVDIPPVKTAYRCIQTALPVPQSLEIFERLNRLETRSMHGQMPIVWDRAKDFQVYDKWGNCWIDFTSTIFVTNIGHSNRFVKKAIRKVLFTNLIHSYTYLNKFRVNYIKNLVEFCGKHFEKAYLASSGTEATETALKLMRMYGLKVSNKKKPGIISVNGNYHGRTLGSFMMSGFSKSKWWIGYEDPNIHFINFPYPWEVDEKSGAKFFINEIENLKNKGVNLNTDISGIILENHALAKFIILGEEECLIAQF